MKRTFAALLTLFTLALPTITAASTWTIDPEHSYVGFKVRHLMVSNVKGNFTTFNGTVDLDDKDVAKSKVAVNIDTNSIDTNVQKRDEHLRSVEFLDVAKYPAMTFTSKKIAQNGKDRLAITGDLTLRGVTREVVLDAEALSPESKDPWGNIRRGTTATTTINRKDFGLTWNAALETGGVVVGDEVAIVLEIEMIRK